jgi:tetratricopeptide (TPR) repeat protein
MSASAAQPHDRSDRVIAFHLSKGLDLLVAGDRTHAASHFADAIVEDPRRPEAYEHLAAMAPTLVEYDALFPGDVAMYTGVLAARAGLLARLGDLHEALRHVAMCARADQTKVWTSTPWWPRLPGMTNPHRAALILTSLTSDLATDADLPVYAPFLDLARDLVDRHPDDVKLADEMCGIADALGASGEADRWCVRAILSAGARDTFSSLRIWRRMTQRPTMESAWTDAIEAEPDRLDIPVNLATGLLSNGRRRDAERWIGHTLARDPNDLGARSLQHALTYGDSGNVAHLIAIVDEAAAAAPGGPLPDALDAILTIVCDTKPWLNRVPMPTEATAAVLNNVGKQRADGSDVSIQRSVVTAIEPPSINAAIWHISPGLVVEVLACPQPDLRVPIAAGRYSVWRYDGTTPIAVAARPSEDVIARFREIANPPWWHPVGAYQHAAALGGVPLDDLLGLLGHIPRSPDNGRWNAINAGTIAYWPRLAAGWACLGILHHRPDEPWQTSTRRRVLVDLVNGIEDWTTDSALFAMIVAAWMAPDARDDVRAIVRARLDEAIRTRQRRLMTIAPSIAELMLITPGCTIADRAASRELVAIDERPAHMSRREISKIKKAVKRLNKS